MPSRGFRCSAMMRLAGAPWLRAAVPVRVRRGGPRPPVPRRGRLAGGIHQRSAAEISRSNRPRAPLPPPDGTRASLCCRRSILCKCHTLIELVIVSLARWAIQRGNNAAILRNGVDLSCGASPGRHYAACLHSRVNLASRAYRVYHRRDWQRAVRRGRRLARIIYNGSYLDDDNADFSRNDNRQHDSC